MIAMVLVENKKWFMFKGMCLKSLAATSKVVSYSVQAYIGIICLRLVSITPVLMGNHPTDAITLSATDGSIDYFLFSNSVLIS